MLCVLCMLQLSALNVLRVLKMWEASVLKGKVLCPTGIPLNNERKVKYRRKHLSIHRRVLFLISTPLNNVGNLKYHVSKCMLHGTEK